MEESHTGPENYYKNQYLECYGTGTIGKTYSWVRRCMERPYDSRSDLGRIIEVGCGVGQYFLGVTQDFDLYVMTDLDRNLINTIDIDSDKVQIKEANAENLNEFADSSFDRLIATCLLVHLDRPMKALTEWRRVIRGGGYLVIYLAPEPGILLRLVRNLFIYPKQKRLGIENVHLLTYSQHKNHYSAMNSMIKEVFKSDFIKRKKYPRMPWNFMLFEILHIKINK
jgi:ubiquinone/menaquinone biosynthesis C-methylase UbiE